jgi:cytochrome b6-f complex iron-sulfur subunit
MVNGDSTNELLDEPPPLRVDRRTVLRLGFLGSIAALVVTAAAAFVRYLWPRDDTPADYFDIPLCSMPRPGEDPIDRLLLSQDGIEAKLYFVNLLPDEGLVSADTHTPGGVIAFSRACTHDRCALSWQGTFAWQFGDTTGIGAFRCACAGGGFTKSGVRFFGPPPRNMDTYELARHGDDIRIYLKRLHHGTLSGSPPDPAMIIPTSTT